MRSLPSGHSQTVSNEWRVGVLVPALSWLWMLRFTLFDRKLLITNQRAFYFVPKRVYTQSIWRERERERERERAWIKILPSFKVSPYRVQRFPDLDRESGGEVGQTRRSPQSEYHMHQGEKIVRANCPGAGCFLPSGWGHKSYLFIQILSIYILKTRTVLSWLDRSPPSKHNTLKEKEERLSTLYKS